MKFRKHLEISENEHAFLSPSNYHWINYDEDKMRSVYKKHQAVERGTKLHALAHDCIELGISLPRSKTTLSRYVNDCIKYRMSPEVKLKYSKKCFGTVDAINFKKNVLRIFDLKTGETKASMTQLKIYAALFCLEYEMNPYDIEFELRIYQSDDVRVETPPSDEIEFMINKIIDFVSLIEELEEDE